jgi:hypothetical protein
MKETSILKEVEKVEILTHHSVSIRSRCDELPICFLAVKYSYPNLYTTRNRYRLQDRNI